MQTLPTTWRLQPQIHQRLFHLKNFICKVECAPTVEGFSFVVNEEQCQVAPDNFLSGLTILKLLLIRKCEPTG